MAAARANSSGAIASSMSGGQDVSIPDQERGDPDAVGGSGMGGRRRWTDAVGGSRGGQGEEESVARRQEGRRAGRKGCEGELRLVPRRQREGRWCRRRGAHSQACRLDVESRAKRDRRGALLEDLERARPHAALETPP